ncbi:chaplin family protein, partial [Microbacterium arborescens]|uniref:chaplin family protein n=1 Tax=Microbacterium arborescens TaxID=33883 RepID=UPI000A554BDD
SVIGDATTDTTGGSNTAGNGGSAADASTGGSDSVLGGAQVVAPVTAPIDLTGTAVSVIGDATTDTTTGGNGGTTGTTSGASTSGSDSILGGTQLVLPITAPISLTGTAISVIGDSTTEVVTPAG